MEERVHPIPFRTRKLSSPSPMILHNVMWESRPLSTIAPKPLAATSARGFVFYPSCSFLLRRPSACQQPSALPPPHHLGAALFFHGLPLTESLMPPCRSARARQPHLRKTVLYPPPSSSSSSSSSFPCFTASLCPKPLNLLACSSA